MDDEIKKPDDSDVFKSPFDDLARDHAIKEVEKELGSSPRPDPVEYIRRVAAKFIETKIDLFPLVCQEFRMVNRMREEQEKEISYKGKFTDTYGWDKNRNFKRSYDIPKEMYLFMTNLVYTFFWDDDNEKVRDAFLKRIYQGEDPIQVLVWVKAIYGSNNQKISVTPDLR